MPLIIEDEIKTTGTAATDLTITSGRHAWQQEHISKMTTRDKLNLIRAELQRAYDALDDADAVEQMTLTTTAETAVRNARAQAEAIVHGIQKRLSAIEKEIKS